MKAAKFCEDCNRVTNHTVTHEGGHLVETCSACGLESCGKDANRTKTRLKKEGKKHGRTD